MYSTAIATYSEEEEAGVPKSTVPQNTVCPEASMDADLTTLCTVVYRPADNQAGRRGLRAVSLSGATQRPAR